MKVLVAISVLSITMLLSIPANVLTQEQIQSLTYREPEGRFTIKCVMPDGICKLGPRIIQASVENTINLTNNFTVPSIQVIKSNNMFMQSILVNFTTDSQVETDYDQKEKVLTITIRPQHLEPVEEEPLKEEEDLAPP